MKSLLLLVALAISACERQEKNSAAVPPPAAPGTALPAEAKISMPPAVIPKPSDQAELDRMILAGFTPHADHLHPPGAKECPLSKGTDAVM
jgi:hypothetical protein